MLDDGRIRHADTRQDESPRDACDRVHGKPMAAEERVDDFIEERNAEDDDHGVDVLHLIVGHAMEFHLRGLGYEVGVELVVYDPEDGVEEEDAASDKGAAELVDKGFVPRGFVFLAVGWVGCQPGQNLLGEFQRTYLLERKV